MVTALHDSCLSLFTLLSPNYHPFGDLDSSSGCGHWKVLAGLASGEGQGLGPRWLPSPRVVGGAAELPGVSSYEGTNPIRVASTLLT